MSQMSRTQAVNFIKVLISPGQPTLGMWFGWNQPNNNDSVKLGSAYGYVAPYTLRQVLANTDLDGETIDDLINDTMSEFNITDREEMLNTEIEDRGIIMADEVFYPYNRLDSEEQALYRLHTMLVNTFTDGHNWAIEYGEALAQSYCESVYADKDWQAYDGNYDTTENLLFNDVELPVSLPYSGDIDWPTLSGSESTKQFITDNNIINILFGDIYDFDVSEVLSWCIDWLIEEYDNGNLTVDLDALS